RRAGVWRRVWLAHAEPAAVARLVAVDLRRIALVVCVELVCEFFYSTSVWFAISSYFFRSIDRLSNLRTRRAEKDSACGSRTFIGLVGRGYEVAPEAQHRNCRDHCVLSDLSRIHERTIAVQARSQECDEQVNLTTLRLRRLSPKGGEENSVRVSSPSTGSRRRWQVALLVWVISEGDEMVRTEASRSVSAVIPAAGRGARLGLDVPKILASLTPALTVWDVLRTLLEPYVDDLHVVLSPFAVPFFESHLTRVK